MVEGLFEGETLKSPEIRTQWGVWFPNALRALRAGPLPSGRNAPGEPGGCCRSRRGSGDGSRRKTDGSSATPVAGLGRARRIPARAGLGPPGRPNGIRWSPEGDTADPRSTGSGNQSGAEWRRARARAGGCSRTAGASAARRSVGRRSRPREVSAGAKRERSSRFCRIITLSSAMRGGMVSADSCAGMPRGAAQNAPPRLSTAQEANWNRVRRLVRSG